MFDRRGAVLNAAGVGYLLSGFLLALTTGSAYFVSRQDPHRIVRRFEDLLTQRAQFLGAGVLGGLLLVGVALAGLYVFLAVSARAARLRPTPALPAGFFLATAAVALIGAAIWTGWVATFAALQYAGARDEMHRHALLIEAHLGQHVFLLCLWSFLTFTALGLFLLGRALGGERGWLPDVLKLAAALILLHLPVKLYLARESLLNEHYVRWLAVLDQLLLWGGLAVACYFSARWLRAVGRSLPP